MTDAAPETEGAPTGAPESAPRRCGYVAILGAPNAGKSTLMNQLVGQKLAIVSPKVQTTRAKILGIQIAGPAQIIYVDTPGIFQPRRRLDRAMVAAAWGGAADADRILLLVDSLDGVTADVRAIIEQLKATSRRAALVLNKVDAVKRDTLLGLAAQLNAEGIFDHVFMISALTGDGTKDVESWVVGQLPVGPWLYPEDQITDVPQRQLAAEITREQLYLQLHDELPYQATVETERWEERADGSARLDQIIYVQRPSQKAIVLGKGGQQAKKIGARARLELERVFERRIHLFLFVKVREGWVDDRERYDAIGLDFNA
jgi:GTP-binding protein Era